MSRAGEDILVTYISFHAEDHFTDLRNIDTRVSVKFCLGYSQFTFFQNKLS